ncbi:MAG: ABC-2 family transporter protein [Caldilineaceae bacterium]
MRYLRLIGAFARAAAQETVAYRVNFFISLMHTLIGVSTGILSLVIIFNQVETVQGWDFPSTLVLLGIYLTLDALRNLFIGPSLNALAGLGGAIWLGTFDFTLLRPVSIQFMATFQRWNLLAMLDLLVGLGVLVIAMGQMGQTLAWRNLLLFLVTLSAGLFILYSLLLLFASLLFWSPGFLFTWIFSDIFPLARYPVELYPNWLRLVLTWVLPVGLITTVPATALNGSVTWPLLLGAVGVAVALFIGASALFQGGLRRYASASS